MLTKPQPALCCVVDNRLAPQSRLFPSSTHVSLSFVLLPGQLQEVLNARNTTGVLASHPQGRDLKFINFSLTFHGIVMFEDTELELNYGRRYGMFMAGRVKRRARERWLEVMVEWLAWPTWTVRQMALSPRRLRLTAKTLGSRPLFLFLFFLLPAPRPGRS